MSLAKKVLPLFVACCICAACSLSSDQKQTINVDGYTLTIPGYLSEATDLNEEASVQYQNAIREVYFIVLDEPTSGFDSMIVNDYELTASYSPDLEGYTSYVSKKLMESIGAAESSPIRVRTDQGIKINILEMNGKVDDLDVFYVYGLLRHNGNYYQILAWTLAERKEKYRSDLLDIVKSFTAK